MAVISQYQVVIPGQTITAALWNGMELNIINNGLIPGGIEDYSSTDGQMQTMTDPFPASAISRPTSLAGELERIRWQFDNIIGGSNWYEDPPVDITTFKTNFDAHTHDGTTNNGPQIQAGGLASNAVTTAKILDANVTTAKLAANAVTANELASNAVTTAKILDSNVTTAKIADANITTVKILDANITGAKIAPTYTISTRPAFLAHYSTTTSGSVTGDNTYANVTFDTEVFDQGSNFSASTFTAPVSGVYVFSYVIYVSGLSTTTHISMTSELVTTAKTYGFNGGQETTIPYSNYCLGDTVVCYMTAGDTAYVRFIVGAGTKNVSYAGDSSIPRTRFSGALLF